MTQPLGSTGAVPSATLAASPQAMSTPKKPVIPNRVTCPICQTSFGPRATSGKCPVCGEQVLPEADVVRVVPGVTPALAWLKAGGWRLVLLVAFALYQLALFIFALSQMKAAGVL